MRINLHPGEEIVRRGGANLQRGLEMVGGHLYLTTERLIFEPHIINIQRKNAIVNLEDVIEVAKCWSKFLNAIPLLPNSIVVKTKDGIIYKFVCFKREEWISAIKLAKEQSWNKTLRSE